MNVELLAVNLLRFLAQSTVLIAAAGLLLSALRVRSPKVRLLVLHVTLLACLALPWVQSTRREFVAPAPVPAWKEDSVPAAGAPVQVPQSRFGVWDAVAAVAAAGCLVRWALLGAGLMRITRRKRRAVPAQGIDGVAADAMRQFDVRAEVLVDAGAKGPVTFGLRRPVVLLPPSFLALPRESQFPVLCHELLHVRRRDWLFALLEEIVRGVLWFHPGVWWLLGRIDLAREQAVDEAVVEFTRERDRYLGVLLEAASVRLDPELAPAPLFLRRHHLTERVACLMQGGRMSKRHLWVSLLLISALLPLAAGLTVNAFPLLGAPQTGEPDAAGVEVKTGPYKLLHRTPVPYPAKAAAVSGDVVVSVRLGPKGEVADASVISGPEPLRAAVLRSVLDWHFDPAGNPPAQFEIAVRFTASSSSMAAQPATAPAPAASAPAPAATPARAVTNVANRPVLKSINTDALPEELRERVMARIEARPGDTLSGDHLSAPFRTIFDLDEHLTLSFKPMSATEVAVVIGLRQQEPGTAARTGAVSTPEPGVQRIRVEGRVAAQNLVTKVAPAYPPLARQARVQGLVQFQAVIDREGRVKELQLIQGHPLLVTSAQQAVAQWVYRPVLLNGNPVEAVTLIDVNFQLAE